MGFNDVKNARMCEIFDGQCLTHSEPALDEEDFKRFLQSLAPLMKPGRDVLRVLGGRTDVNNPKLKHALTRNSFHYKEFHLFYNTKHMAQYGHFKKQRGIANSRSHELLFLCYKGRLPKLLAKTRVYVDAGSVIFNEVVRNVLVLSQKCHALVSREIREKSLHAMIGTDVAEVEAKDQTTTNKNKQQTVQTKTKKTT